MVGNVSFSGRVINDNVMYMRTGNYNRNDSEIILNRDDISKLNDNLGLKYSGFQYISGDKLASYLQGLNNILPKNVKFEPEIDKKHEFSVYALCNDDSIQFRDETNHSHILSITDVSTHEE